MSLELIDDGYACIDCVMMMANGETGDPDDSEERIEEVAQATAGWSPADSDEHPDQEFSCTPCRCCRSHLGGRRGWVVKLGHVNKGSRVMIAYHNDPAIKAEYLGRVREHAKADQLVKGQYWSEGRGCAVGCTIHGDDHLRYETELGIPVTLARLEDRIFEGLPNAQAMTWPERFLSAITPGADLSLVGKRFLAWLVRDVSRFADGDTRTAILSIADLYDRESAGEVIQEPQWREARKAAAASAAAADAAYAAYAASATAAASAAARDAHYVTMSDRLLELLSQAQPAHSKETA